MVFGKQVQHGQYLATESSDIWPMSDKLLNVMNNNNGRDSPNGGVDGVWDSCSEKPVYVCFTFLSVKQG